MKPSDKPPRGQVEPSQVLRRFRVIFSAVRSHFKQVEKLVGLGGAQVWTLSVVNDNEGIGLTELARRMDIHQSTTSNLVRGLQAKALLRLERDDEDKRHVHLYATAAGRALLAKVPTPFEGVLPQALAQLPAQTLIRLDQDLSELSRLLNVDEDAGGIPLANL
jgi:DNA-binding MarR family transcriptional regulator